MSLAGMRIGLDARTGSERGVGVSTYAGVLAEVLRGAGAEVEQINDGRPGAASPAATLRRWAAALGRGPRQMTPAGTPPTRIWIYPDVFRRAQVHFNLYGRLLPVRCADPPAIMHWTYPLPLHMEGARNVYTLHDAIPLDHPDLTNIDPGRHLRLLQRIAASADLLVTVSEHSRARLSHWLPQMTCPIVNTYQAAAVGPSARPPLPAGLQAGRYLLVCGTVEPRKNLARLRLAHRRSGVELPLVVVGPDGWRAAQALPPGLTGAGLIRLPWLERPTLVSLIQSARALLFPSLAEGFGLPALEAMSLGAPVLTSDRGGLAEVARGAACIVDPTSVPKLALAIRQICSDDALCDRLAQAGRRQAERFSSDAYATRLAEAYQALPPHR